MEVFEGSYAAGWRCGSGGHFREQGWHIPRYRVRTLLIVVVIIMIRSFKVASLWPLVRGWFYGQIFRVELAGELADLTLVADFTFCALWDVFHI